MSGSGAKITVQDGDVVGALSRLIAAAGDVSGALKNVGEDLQRTTKERIRKEVSPDGTPFEPLNFAYASVEKKGPGILRGENGENGGLSAIVYQLGSDGQSVEVGNNVVYGAIHQFGGVIRPKSASALVFSLGGRTVHADSVEIPARPYLGVSAEDRENILDAFEFFLSQAAGDLAGD